MWTNKELRAGNFEKSGGERRPPSPRRLPFCPAACIIGGIPAITPKERQKYEIRNRWIIGLFISQYTFIKLNISHIYELFRYINPYIYIYFHDKLVRNWCGVWEATFGKRVHHDRLFVKNESCKEINTVNHLLSCEFNIDTACVELKYADGSMISIDTIAVENEVADNMYERSELDWLIFNAPAEYADLVLNGDPVKYLKTVTVYKPFEN